MNRRTHYVLRLLRQAEDHLSGELIARKCSITRSAVWKHIELLRRCGYRIESCQRRGYRLGSSASVTQPWEIGAALKTERFGRNLEYLERIDSTNRLAIERARSGAPEGTTILAEAQTAGRGRRGRPWLSPPRRNLYFSIVLRPPVAPPALGQLPLVAAVALHRVIERLAPEVPTRIKWPNDILAASGRKLAGILCEAGVETDRVHYAVVGIGINVNAGVAPRGLESIATSLAREGGRDYSRQKLLAAILNTFEQHYLRWLATGSLWAFLAHIETSLAFRGEVVEVAAPGGPVRGRVVGVAPGGELLLRGPSGRGTAVAFGDVEPLAGDARAGAR